MNINDQMRELATAGGVAYAPSDDLIASLVNKTRRVRATRQSAATLASAIGAVALGIVATHAYNAAKDDPALRDRNIINNKDGLSQIELYRAKFGQENPTRTYQSTDLSDIIDRLKDAARPPSAPKPTTVQPASGGDAKPAVQAPKVDPIAQCKADNPPKPYATYDCTKQKWVVNPGWYKDPNSGTYYQCSAQPAYEGYTYDCSKGKYVPKAGYFLVGNGAILKNIQWTDATTGVVSWGNWTGTGSGWEKKAVFTSGPSDLEYDYYVYMGNYASWSGSTCTGVEKTKWGAQMKASCLPESTVAGTGKTYKMHDGVAWVLVNQNLKWHSHFGEFKDPDNPPEGWCWDGNTWATV